MVIAQCVLVSPIIAALADRSSRISGTTIATADLARGAAGTRGVDAAVGCALLTADGAARGFGRAIAEVGSIIIVGGNIDHVTRTMTTAIVLQTSRGDIATALGLGIILLALTLAINAAAYAMGTVGSAAAGQGCDARRAADPAFAPRGRLVTPWRAQPLDRHRPGDRRRARSVIVGPNGAGKSLLLRLCMGARSRAPAA